MNAYAYDDGGKHMKNTQLKIIALWDAVNVLEARAEDFGCAEMPGEGWTEKDIEKTVKHIEKLANALAIRATELERNTHK